MCRSLEPSSQSVLAVLRAQHLTFANRFRLRSCRVMARVQKQRGIRQKVKTITIDYARITSCHLGYSDHLQTERSTWPLQMRQS
jgi:hypothetical protein